MRYVESAQSTCSISLASMYRGKRWGFKREFLKRASQDVNARDGDVESFRQRCWSNAGSCCFRVRTNLHLRSATSDTSCSRRPRLRNERGCDCDCEVWCGMVWDVAPDMHRVDMPRVPPHRLIYASTPARTRLRITSTTVGRSRFTFVDRFGVFR
jgi:hypothetical protein